MSAKDQGFPPPAVETRDILAYAAGLGEWLAARYARLAERARSAGREETARLFAELAARAREGLERLRRYAREQGIEAGAARPLPGGLLEEDLIHSLELWERRPELATPYRVLAVAVRLQDTLFRLCAGLGGTAATPEARELAERLAREALAEAADLRSRRRAAFHAARPEQATDEPFGGRVRSAPELAQAAERIDRELARRLEAACRAQPELLSRLRDDPVLAPLLASLAAAVETPAAGEPDRETVEPLRAFAERAFEFYDRVFAGAESEDVMLEAQERERVCLALLHALDAFAAGAVSRSKAG